MPVKSFILWRFGKMPGVHADPRTENKCKFPEHANSNEKSAVQRSHIGYGGSLARGQVASFFIKNPILKLEVWNFYLM